jgi:diguanylate cyclase (GGDEF)-like protein/PAS domain S-box-containing protein
MMKSKVSNLNTFLNTSDPDLLFKMAFNQHFQFMAILSPEGRVLEINELALSSQGALREDFVGKLLWESPAWRDLPEWKNILQQRLLQAERQKTPVKTEDIYQIQDGLIRYADAVTTALFKSNDGPLIGFIIQASDTTERCLSEIQACESNQRLESIFKAAPTGIGLVKERFIKEVNELICQMTGYTQEELINQSARMLYPTEEEYNYVGREKYRQIQAKGTGSVETRWQCKDGHIIDVLLSSTPLDCNDLSKGVTFTALDITAQKKAETDLKKSQEKYHDLYENAPDMYVSVDAKTTLVIECNQTLVDTLGFTKSEIIDHPVFNLYTSESVEYAKNTIFSLFQKTGEIRNEQGQLRKKDGGHLDVSLNVTAVRDEQGDILRSRSVWRDISKIKQLEHNLQTTLNRYKGFFEYAPHPYHALDEEGNIIEVNSAWRKALGYSLDDVQHMWFGDLLEPDSIEQFKKLYSKFKAAGKVHGAEFKMRHKEGHLIDVAVDGKIVRDAQGKFRQTHCIFSDITRQKHIDAQLKLFRQQINQSKDAIYVLDSNSSKFIDVNKSACKMLGYSKAELLEKSILEISGMITNQKNWQELSTFLKTEEDGAILEDEHLHRDGKKLPVEVSAIYQINNGQEVFVASVRDISERKIKEQQLKDKNKFIQMVIDGITVSVMVINTDYTVSMMNSAAKNLIDKTHIKDINAPKCYEVSHHQAFPCTNKHHPCPLSQVLASKELCSVRHQHLIADGEVSQVELTASPLIDENGEVYAIIESAHDITKLIQTQDNLHEQSLLLDYQAHYDELTKLPNRLLLRDRLNQTIKHAHRHRNKIAVLFIDLDDFKKINDSLGHSVGDIVLKKTARRLQLCVREEDTVARLGGDEFIVIINDIKDSDVVIEISTKIIYQLQREFQVHKNKLYISTSIGISLYPDDAISSEELLRNSDTAMYKAKDGGKNSYQFYTEEMTQKAFEHILMESNLRHALEHNELIVYYQPQVDSKNNKIIGMEALVRWQHPKIGLISPAQFIPLAEQTGLIIPLGEFVFDAATKQMSRWMSEFKLSGRMAINLSVKQLQLKNLYNILSDKLITNHCKPEWVELEITENDVMNNPEQAIKSLKKLQNIGIEIAIDDFGTGYSSLSYLKRLPINKLKIDQSFVKDMVKDEDDRIIINSTIDLAKNMKLGVIAEGVETIEQKDYLLEHGCKLIQGYYYSPPVPVQEINILLKSTLK